MFFSDVLRWDRHCRVDWSHNKICKSLGRDQAEAYTSGREQPTFCFIASQLRWHLNLNSIKFATAQKISVPTAKKPHNQSLNSESADPCLNSEYDSNTNEYSTGQMSDGIEEAFYFTRAHHETTFPGKIFNEAAMNY